MTSATDYIHSKISSGEWDQAAVYQKCILNKDFTENAILKHAVQAYHYLAPGGHAALSVSGNSYGFYPLGFPCKEEALETAIINAREGSVPIWVGRISTTPKRLLQLEKKLDQKKIYFCVTCSDAVSSLIRKEINPDVKISVPISFLPSLTRWSWSKHADGKNNFPGVIYGGLNGSKLITPNRLDKMCMIIEVVHLIFYAYILYSKPF